MNLGASSSSKSHRQSASASSEEHDVSRDEIQCLFRAHDDLIESLIQVSMSPVFDILRTMLREVSKMTDSPESQADLFEDGLSKTADWNRMTVREVTRSWAKLSGQMVMLVHHIARIKALIMKKNGLIKNADVNVTLEFSSILHTIVVFSSTACIEDMDSLLKSNGSQSFFEIIIRRHQCVEKAVVHLLRDALNECMMEDSVSSIPSSKKRPGTFPSVFANSSVPEDEASESLSVLRYSVPQIEAAKAEPLRDSKGKEVKFEFSTDLVKDDEDDFTYSSSVEDEDFPPEDGKQETVSISDMTKTAVSEQHDSNPIHTECADVQPLDLNYAPLVTPTAPPQSQQSQSYSQSTVAPSSQPMKTYATFQNNATAASPSIHTNSISRDLAKILLRDL